MADLETSTELLALIERSRTCVMTPTETYEQRRSFVRGCCPSNRNYAEWCAEVDRQLPPLEQPASSDQRAKIDSVLRTYFRARYAPVQMSSDGIERVYCNGFPFKDLIDTVMAATPDTPQKEQPASVDTDLQQLRHQIVEILNCATYGQFRNVYVDERGKIGPGALHDFVRAIDAILSKTP